MIVSSLEFARVFCYRSCSKTIDVIIELSRAFIVISLLASGDLIHLNFLSGWEQAAETTKSLLR